MQAPACEQVAGHFTVINAQQMAAARRGCGGTWLDQFIRQRVRRRPLGRRGRRRVEIAPTEVGYVVNERKQAVSGIPDPVQV